MQKSNLHSDWKKGSDHLGHVHNSRGHKKVQPYFTPLKAPQNRLFRTRPKRHKLCYCSENVIAKSGCLYLKDTILDKFQALKAFDSSSHIPNTSAQGYIRQFEKLYFQLTSHSTVISEGLLAYKLLKSPQDERIAKSTISDLTLSNMKSQLKRFSLIHQVL